MSPADRFARLPALLAADDDLRRRGRRVDTDCRIASAASLSSFPCAAAPSRRSIVGLA